MGLSKLGQAGTGRKKVEQEVLVQIEGRWMQESDQSFMGEIRNGVMLWDAVFQHAPSKLLLAKGIEGPCQAADIELELSDERHWGRFENKDEPKILWSDGEVWVHCDDAPSVNDADDT